MKKSNKTLRLTGIPEGETREQIEAQALADSKVGSSKLEKLFRLSRKSSSNADASSDLLGTSLAQQRDLNTATITFMTSAAKDRVLDSRQKRHDKTGKGAYIDDDFRGITILHSGSTEQRVDLEYALHSSCCRSMTLTELQHLRRSWLERACIRYLDEQNANVAARPSA